jgi:hypothetical protein
MQLPAEPSAEREREGYARIARDAHSDWMDECVPDLMASGKDQLVAVAACLNIWRDAWEESHPDGADDPGPDRPEKQQITPAQARAWLAKKAPFDESQHPRDEDGKFTDSGGGTSSAKPSKSKAKKEDFDKAKVALPPDKAAQDAFIEKWNDKVGVDPATFKKNFMGGLDGPMRMSATGNQINVNGEVQDSDGNKLGDFQREINLDSKSAYSAYFKLNRTATKHDTGKKLLAGNIETYKQLGIEKVTVSANIDVGGYAWAKYGYVPTAASWSALRGQLERKLTGSGSGGGGRTSSGMEADSWDMLSSDVQDDVRDKWMRESHSEFLDSEIQNWRDSGQALGDAKSNLADNFVSAPDWAVEALDAAREDRKEQGLPPIPYTNDQLFGAISLEYDNDGDGRGDPKVEFDDAYLKQPQGYDEGQGTLPGIEPLDPASFLTEPMREEITNNLVESFTKQAESDADDMEPPDYIADGISEYQDEYWDQKDDDEKLRHAIDYGMADIEIEPDEDEEAPQAEMDLPKTGDEVLLAALHSSDPKSIWKVADSPKGKELLLGTNWSGVLKLNDKETMDRFNKYVGKAA